ncbi:uncharacterized protein BDCG_04779 [Blastomyces dermatitidis ER-3]|uniref:DUF7924 domain-containing protein n=1 Tax=Ajellomyces dermatitidis (strain ER-3 / ATCC MYA-2586) TaxID=559297 RepID=A0ABP2F008_AJEDR|nr:uncharacterized protein BDCG_04779 [Blastomyces dermatitidis ER-3]EEQ89659.2 hypothetical protein BDCG_04779 [Blastomyces dermatitidis ER-3]
MPPLGASNLRKRQQQAEHPSERHSKRQQLDHSTSAYWDNLSKIYLTKNAIREHDRRNSTFKQLQKLHKPVHRRHCRPNTRQFQAEQDARLELVRLPGFLCDCSPTQLKEITRLSRLGGPDLSDLKNERLAQPRASLSPSKFSEKCFEDFREADAHASKEPVTTSVNPVLDGDIGDHKCVGGEYSFGNLAPLTDGTLSSAKPDHFFGARPEQLNHSIREALSDQIIPSTQDDLPMMPNFFLEVKGPDGSLAVTTRQACYNGALGARGMHTLQSYQQEPTYNNNGYTLTSTYHGGTLKLYTTHVSKSDNPDSRPEYFMTQLRSFALTDTSEAFRQGASAYRNDSTPILDDSDGSTNEYQDAQWSFAAPVEEVPPGNPKTPKSRASESLDTAGDEASQTTSDKGPRLPS